MTRPKPPAEKKRSGSAKKARFAADEALLAQFEALVNNDDDEKALQLVAANIKDDSHPELKQIFKEALSSIGDLEAAYHICIEAEKTNTDSSELAFHLGELSVGLDQHAQAMAHFEKAQSLGSSSSDLYQLWGASAVAAGQLTEAETHFSVALELDPERVADVYSAWGKALCDAGHLENAREKLNVAIAADNTAFYPHAYLGVVMLQEHEDVAAERAFRKALDLIPHGHDAYAAWIVQELAQVVERHQGNDAAADLVRESLRRGRRSLPLFERLRRLQGLSLGPTAKHFVMVLAGEDEQGDFYEECEVYADNEESALRFVRALHDPKEQEALVVADLKVTGKPQSSFAGVVDISDKTRVPEWADEPQDEDDEGLSDDDDE